MITIDSLVNVFTEADFIPDPYGRKKAGKPLSVLRDVGLVHKKLRELGFQYTWEPINSGLAEPASENYPKGRWFFTGKLTVTLNGVSYAVPGCGDTPEGTWVGLAGSETLALQNAALRGLGMAEWLYVNDKVADAKVAATPVAVPVVHIPTPLEIAQAEVARLSQQSVGQVNSVPTPAPVQQVSYPPAPTSNPVTTPTAATATPKTNRFGGKTGYSKPAGQAQSSKPFPPWDGTLKFKSGKYADVMYKDVPIEHLQLLSQTSQPLQTVLKELERRMGVSGLPSLELAEQY